MGETATDPLSVYREELARMETKLGRSPSLADYFVELRAEREVGNDLFLALKRLERAATEVSRYGATTGRQWVGLTDALIRARAALSRATGEAG